MIFESNGRRVQKQTQGDYYVRAQHYRGFGCIEKRTNFSPCLLASKVTNKSNQTTIKANIILCFTFGFFFERLFRSSTRFNFCYLDS